MFCGRLRFSVSLLSHLDAVDLSRGPWYLQTRKQKMISSEPRLHCSRWLPAAILPGRKLEGEKGGKQRTLLPSPFVVLWPKGCGPANAQGVQSYSAIKKPPH